MKEKSEMSEIFFSRPAAGCRKLTLPYSSTIHTVPYKKYDFFKTFFVEELCVSPLVVNHIAIFRPQGVQKMRFE